MNFFLNYKNGNLSVKTFRDADAEATTLEDIQRAYSEGSDEVLVASFVQDFDYDEDLKIATFSGISYSAEKGFDICDPEEAHDVADKESAMMIWGINEDLTPGL